MRSIGFFHVVSLRRVLLGATGVIGCVLTLRLALRPAFDGPWNELAALGKVLAGGASATAAVSAVPVAVGLVSVAVEPAAAARAAILLRDGIAAGRFAAGPLTIGVRAGDRLQVSLSPGAPAGWVRITSASADVAAPRPVTLPIAPGHTVALGTVRLAPAGSPV